MGAREFQRFLVAKQREIAAVVADAHELDRAKAAVLESCGESTACRRASEMLPAMFIHSRAAVNCRQEPT